MREIKFRAYKHVDTPGTNNGGEHRMERVSGWHESKRHKYISLENWNSPQRREEWTIMQYTGLKDKNGKGIYEGDILDRVINPLPKYMRVVEWRTERNRNGWNIAKGEAHEIIGNIYENPELLKPTKE